MNETPHPQDQSHEELGNPVGEKKRPRRYFDDEPNPEQWTKCPTCDGRGWVWDSGGHDKKEARCFQCDGEGVILRNPEVHIRDFEMMPLELQKALAEMVKCALYAYKNGWRPNQNADTQNTN